MENQEKKNNIDQPIVIKSLPDNQRLYNEYDFIIASFNHGTSFIGKSEETKKHHNQLVYWLEERQKEFKGNVIIKYKMEQTDKVGNLLSIWCDNEMEECRKSIKELEGQDSKLYQTIISNKHLELSMYQSFKNKITSIAYNPIPTDEQIEAIVYELTSGGYEAEMSGGMQCAKAVRDFVLAVTPNEVSK